MLRLQQNNLDIKLTAISISFLLSVWMVFNTDLINADSIIYLNTAEWLSQGEWHKAFDIFYWLLYSWLISFASQLTGLELEYAGYLINFFLDALIVYAFLLVLIETGADRKTILAGAIIILILPIINTKRGDLYRDHGYVAFYLTSLVFFIRYYRHTQWQDAIGWWCSLTVASLFRIEGIAFIVLLPFIILFSPHIAGSQRVFVTLRLFIPHAVLLIVLVAFYAIGHGEQLSSSVAMFESIIRTSEFWAQLTTGVGEKRAVLESMLGHNLKQYAAVALIVTFCTILISKTIGTLTPLYTVISIHGHFGMRSKYARDIVPIVYWLVIIHLVIAAYSVIGRHILVGRYLVALVLTILVFAPYSLVYLYRAWQTQRTLLFPTVCFLMALLALDGVYSFGLSKDYIKDSGVWIKTIIKPGERLFSSGRRARYYAMTGIDRYQDEIPWQQVMTLVKSGDLDTYDYLAFRVRSKHRQDIQVLRNRYGMPINKFVDSKENRVLVFKKAIQGH